jgi:phytol kinase
MDLGEMFQISSNDIIALVLVYILIAIVLVVSQLIQKKYGDRFDIRKIIHIGIGNFVFIWWMFEHAWVMEAFFAIPFAIILFFAMLKDNAISNSALGDISQNKGHKPGLFLYVMSIVILVALCFNEHWSAASIGIVAMTWGDGFGSIIGKRYGKHKSFNGKSVEGTLAVFIVTAAVSMILMVFLGFMPLPDPTGIRLVASIPIWACCIIAGAVVSVTETFTPGWIDNIVNCMAVTAVMILLGL